MRITAEALFHKKKGKGKISILPPLIRVRRHLRSIIQARLLYRYEVRLLSYRNLSCCLRGGAGGGYNYDDDYYGGQGGGEEDPYYEDAAAGGGWGDEGGGGRGRDGGRYDRYEDDRGAPSKRGGKGASLAGFDLTGTITNGNKSELGVK